MIDHADQSAVLVVPSHESVLRARIQSVCAVEPNLKARWRKMQSVSLRWVLYSPQLRLWAGMRGMEIVPVESQREAVTFDGRDNEQSKRDFYRAITGIDWQVQLVNAEETTGV